MKKTVATLLVFGMVFGLVQCQTAMAIPVFKEKFVEKYVTDSKDDAFKAAANKAGCNVCHVGMNKKDKNEYGKAMAEFLKKADFPMDKIKGKPDEVKKQIFEAFEKTEAKKNAEGKTFGELLKAGKLPGGN